VYSAITLPAYNFSKGLHLTIAPRNVQRGYTFANESSSGCQRVRQKHIALIYLLPQRSALCSPFFKGQRSALCSPYFKGQRSALCSPSFKGQRVALCSPSFEGQRSALCSPSLASALRFAHLLLKASALRFAPLKKTTKNNKKNSETNFK
jgi:hypothetical protein